MNRRIRSLSVSALRAIGPTLSLFFLLVSVPLRDTERNVHEEGAANVNAPFWKRACGEGGIGLARLPSSALAGNLADGKASVSEYIRELIRADQLKKQQDVLERQLLEGLAGGKGRGLSKADIASLKKTLLERAGNSPTIE